MAAEEQIFTALQALVGGSCYPEVASQGAALPYIVYNRVSAARENTLNKSVTLSNPLIEIGCYAATLAAARTLAASVIAAMETAGVTNQLEDDFLEYDPATDLDFVMLRYSCWETG
jgi:hypothetical protein